MANTGKSYKDDKEYQKYLKRKNSKQKLLVWLIFLGVVSGVGGIGYAILKSNGVEVENNSEVVENDIPEEYKDRMILKVKSDDSETNTVQFNTIYGGTDYNKELSDYKKKSGNQDIDNVIRYLDSEVSVENEFNTLESWLKEVREINQGYASDLYTIAKGSPLTLEMLKGDNQLTLELTCVGVVDNYYGVFWLEGTDFYFVSDERNTRLSKDFFYNQMYHIGKEVYFSFNTQDISMEHNDALNIDIIYMPNYNLFDFNTTAVVSDENNEAFDRYDFCQVNSDDYEVLMSFISTASEKFDFSVSALSFDDVTKGRVRSFSSRRNDNPKEVLNSSWNSNAESVVSDTVGVYTIKGAGFVCEKENYVALKYSDDIYFVLDVSNAPRDLSNSHDTNSFVAPFSLLTSNIRVIEVEGKTYVLGYFV